MVRRNTIETNLNKAARIALIVLLQNSQHKVNTAELAQLTGVNIRSIQRDMHDAFNVHTRLAPLLQKYNMIAQGAILRVPEVARELGISERRVRFLAKSRGVGNREGRDWWFFRSDLEKLKPRKAGRPKSGASTV